MKLGFYPNLTGPRTQGGMAAPSGLLVGLSASDRRFQSNLLTEAQEAADRQLAGMNDLLEMESTNAAKLQEVHTEVTNALAEAVRINTDAVNAIEAANNEDRDTQNRRLEGIERLLTEMQNSTVPALAELDRRLSALVTTNGNVLVIQSRAGVVFKTPDDSAYYKLTIDDTGAVQIRQVALRQVVP